MWSPSRVISESSWQCNCGETNPAPTNFLLSNLLCRRCNINSLAELTRENNVDSSKLVPPNHYRFDCDMYEVNYIIISPEQSYYNKKIFIISKAKYKII